MTSNVTRISSVAARRYSTLKATVRSWVNDSLAVGLALREIRDDRLYLDEYETFEEFADREYGFKRNYAYKLIQSAEVKDSLGDSPAAEQVTTEGQTRALAAVPKEDRKAVVEAAAETGKVTARTISEAAKKIVAPEPEDEPEPAPKPKAAPQPIIELDRIGYPIPPEIQSDWDRALEFKETLRQLQDIKNYVRRALDEEDVIFREVTNPTVIDLQNAYNSLQQVIPHVVCTTCQGLGRDDCTFCRGRGFISKFSYERHVPADVRRIREAGVNGG